MIFLKCNRCGKLTKSDPKFNPICCPKDTCYRRKKIKQATPKELFTWRLGDLKKGTIKKSFSQEEEEEEEKVINKDNIKKIRGLIKNLENYLKWLESRPKDQSYMKVIWDTKVEIKSLKESIKNE